MTTIPRTDPPGRTPDAAYGPIDRMPAGLRPYLRLMRVDRPIGVWLLLWPCLWGVLVARPTGFEALTFWRLCALFAVGAFAMRSAGCAYNDIVDKDLDAKVERTAARPVASGQIGRREAAGLVIGLSLLGFGVLIQLPGEAIVAGLASLALVAGYPFMKRITWWPQAWLGLTFNWGVIVGAAAAANGVSAAALAAYAGGVCWTLGYDTIYACQDIEDDALAGVKSSARALGSRTRTGVLVFYAAASACWIAALWAAGAGPMASLALLPAAHLAWQVVRLDPTAPDRCLRLFKSNVWTGGLVTLAMLAA